MGDANLSLDARGFAHHQRGRLVGHRRDITDDLAIDTQSTSKTDVAFDLGADADQTVNAALRLVGLLAAKHACPLVPALPADYNSLQTTVLNNLVHSEPSAKS